MSHDEAFERCIAAFAAGDYTGCMQQTLMMLMAEPTLGALQLWLISMQRAGAEALLGQLAPQMLESCMGEDVPQWETALLKLTLGQSDLSAVLEQATDDLQRCQARYYGGARLLTVGAVEQAYRVLGECAAMECACLERRLAQHELARQGISPALAATIKAEQEFNLLSAQVTLLHLQGRFTEAVAAAAEILEWAREHLGEGHPSFATGLINLAQLYQATGEFARAESLYLQALEIRRAALGERHPDFAAGLQNLAMLYALTGKYDRAEAMFGQAAEVLRAAVGERHLLLAACLNNQADLYRGMARFSEAERLYVHALEIRSSALGDRHPVSAESMLGLATLSEATGDYARAEQLFHQALEVVRAVFGEQHPHCGEILGQLADHYLTTGNFAQAEQLRGQALEICRAGLGERHPSVARQLNGLAVSVKYAGNFSRAEELYRQALEIQRAALGEQHPEYAMTLSNLANLYREGGDFTRAEPLYLDALKAIGTALGERHPSSITVLNNLAALYMAVGDYPRAEQQFHQVLALIRAALGEQHLHFAKALNNLAAMHQAAGDYARAEPLYLQASEVIRVTGGEGHPDSASPLNNLSELYRLIGDTQRGETFCRQALEVRRAAFGERHPDFAQSLNNLAVLYETAGRHAEAEPLRRQALEILRTAIGEHNPAFASCLGNMAMAYEEAGEHSRAEELHRRALEITRTALGERHPDFADSLNNLALWYEGAGDPAHALPLLRQALEVHRSALGEQHPRYAQILTNLAVLHIAMDRPDEALGFLAQAAAIHDRLIGQVFSLASDRQRVAFLREPQQCLEVVLSVVTGLTSRSPGAVHTALDLVLRRKRLRVEAEAVWRNAVFAGAYPHLQPRLHEFNLLSAQIVRKALAGPGLDGLDAHVRQLADWEARREELERELARQIPEINLEKRRRAADRAAVALALPADSALVEFVRFDVHDFKVRPPLGERRRFTGRYAAFILPAGEPDRAEMIDLGEATPIDRLVAEFRTGLTRGPTRDLRPAEPADAPADAGARLRALVFDRLLPALAGRTNLFLAPDGDLTRLPFAVLPTDDGRLLGDRYSISYVGSGRDVLRFAAPVAREANAPFVVCDPDFDLGSVNAGPASAADAPRGRCSRDLTRGPRARGCGRLEWTLVEGQAVSALLGVAPCRDRDVLKKRLLAAWNSPRILHLATHGFFLPDQADVLDREVWGRMLDDSGRLRPDLRENALLRSGLVLAGYNTFVHGGSPPEEADNGMLTALDVSGLNLLSTDLVVLSACETGLGDVQVGEGVFGLQRAFTLAGARTLVMSLWAVPDDATRLLMEDFYHRLLAGEGKADALRNAQQTLRHKPEYADPYYWGAFICQGDPGPLRPSAAAP